MKIVDDNETPLTPDQVAEVLRWCNGMRGTPDGTWVVRYSTPTAITGGPHGFLVLPSGSDPDAPPPGSWVQIGETDR